jgi:hypothetical protein
VPWTPARLIGTFVVGGLIAGAAWALAGWEAEVPPFEPDAADVAAGSSPSTTAGAAGAVGAGSDATAATSTTVPPTTTTTEPPLTGPVRLVPSSRFDLRGVGPIEAGMTVHQAEAASGLRLTLTPISTTGGRCSTAKPPLSAVDGLDFVVLAPGGAAANDPKAGTIARGRATLPSFATVSGARVGTTIDEARGLYAGRFEELRFGRAGVALTIKGRSAADRDFAVRIESTDGLKVTSISSGRIAALAAPDGCA